MCRNKIEKREIRKKYLNIRKNICNKEIKSKKIFDKIIETEEYLNAKIIALYKNLDSEVNTKELIEFSIKIGKIVALPRVLDDEIKFYKINFNEDKLEKSKFGVKEPEENEKNLINKNMIDLVIVPGVCFDVNKNRLGFGKGYYDKFLKDTNFKTIGICFEEQVLKNAILPVEENDIKMQKIITEEIIY